MTNANYDHPPLKPLDSYDILDRLDVALQRAYCLAIIARLRRFHYKLRVECDGEYMTPPKASTSEIMCAFGNLDSALLRVKGKDAVGWIKFEFSNDGVEIVQDCSLWLSELCDDAVADVCARLDNRF